MPIRPTLCLLAAAGVPYAVEGPDGPLYADFHALRHTYVSMLARSGATVKQAQTLARHSKVELTLGRYAHTALPELGEAVGRLPALAGPANGTPSAADGAEALEVVAVPAEDLAALPALASVGLAVWAALLAGRCNPACNRCGPKCVTGASSAA